MGKPAVWRSVPLTRATPGEGLATEIGTIDEEEHAAGAGVFDEPVGERAGGVGLARAGGHLDEGARVGLGEGGFEAGDALDLAVAQVLRRERRDGRHRGEARAEGVGLGGAGGERLGSVEGEDAAGARVRVAFVAEERFDAGGFVEERKGSDAGGEERGQEIGERGGVVGGLLGDAGERGAGLLGFDHANRLAADEEQIIAGAGLELDFAEGDAGTGGKVDGFDILNDPAGRDELGVDLLAGLGFGRKRHAGREKK